MTTYSSSIAANGEPQWVPVDPNDAAESFAFVNQSDDVLILAWDGFPAGQTHGLRCASGSRIDVSRTGAALGGLWFPWGPLSVWGPTANQTFEVLLDE